MYSEAIETKNPLGYEPVGKLIGKFAIPCVVSLIVNSLYNIVDQIFIGHGVGYLGNGATNVVFPITIITLAIALLIGDGGAAYLSLKLGEGKEEDAARGVGNAILLSIVSGIVLLVIGLIFLNPLLYLFGCTDVLYPYASEYGRVIVLGIPFVVISTALNSIIRADGSPKYAMASMILGAVFNTLLDPLFIFVFGWGVTGAAVATIIGQIASCAVSLLYLGKFKSISVKIASLALKAEYCKTVCMLGISSFITQAAVVVVMAVTNNLLAAYGAQSAYGAEIPITALGITMKVNQIMISILVGIAAGAQPIIGYNYGSKQLDRVQKTLKWTILSATVVTVICFLIFQFATQSVIDLFGSGEGLYNEFATKCFKIFLLACVLNGFQTVASIFMQAIGKPVQSAILSLSRQIVVLVPAAFILSGRMGVEGVLWAGPVADMVAFILAAVLLTFEMHKLMKPDRCIASLEAQRL
ncbi:MAG: MATE family efflux transporter [Lachnospiraceae bacterium]